MTVLGLKCIHFFETYRGPDPTYAEIALGIGTSKQQAAKTVGQLIRARYLERAGQPMKRTHGICGLKLRVHQEAQA